MVRGRLLVVCGRLLVVCSGSRSFTAGLRSFVLVCGLLWSLPVLVTTPTEYNFTNTYYHKEFHLKGCQGVSYPALLYKYFK